MRMCICPMRMFDLYTRVYVQCACTSLMLFFVFFAFQLDKTAYDKPNPAHMYIRSKMYYGFLVLTSTKAGKLTGQFIDITGAIRK